MATASIPNSFTNGTNADANLVNANFSYLSSWLNTNVIQPSVANFSVFPTLPSSNPTSDYQAAHKSYVDLFMPAGVITQYVGTAAPSGWRLCDGTLYNAADSTYARLWATIGTTYGGSGINSFAVPDLKGRVPVGYGAGAGLTARNLNDKAGTETHTLTEAQMPQHRHSQSPHNHTQNPHEHIFQYRGSLGNGNGEVYGDFALGGGSTVLLPPTGYGGRADSRVDSVSVASNPAVAVSLTATNNATTPPDMGLTGGNAAHNIMQPFVVVSYIIKL